ncbi:MAG TPA: Ig-like domain-containing protein [Candidatus Excrementavichristensenella intestinipullorum]|nr:Ig-like domain-containing protein [Candidatus Excrementavichristensenella intestinipullorum]
MDSVYGEYAIIFYNFRVCQVMDGKYIETQMEDAEMTKDSESKIYQLGFTNNTTDDATASGTLTTNFTETVTLSSGTSHEYSKEHSVSVNLGASIGTDADLFGGEVGFQYSYTWGEVTGENFTNGTEKSNSQEISSSISMTLPAHTQAVMLQETGDATMSQSFAYPVALLYDVYVLYYGTKDDPQTPGLCVNFTGENNRNSYDARSDLHQRAVQGSTDPNGLTYSTTKGIAKNIWEQVPLSTIDTSLKYACQYTTNKLHSITPMYDLKFLELTRAADKSVSLPVGGTLDVDQIGVTGLDVENVPYHGFNQEKGQWVLLNSDGTEATGNANEYAELTENKITGQNTLQVLKGGGTVYLRYKIDENAYKKVDNTPDPDDGDPITNADLTNRAVVTINTLEDALGYSITASGEIVACAGDGDIDLNGSSSPVSAMVLDASGKQVSASVTWEAQKLTGIAIDNGTTLKLSTATPGTYHIRPVWNGLYPADWLTVTVRPKRELTSIEISDPDGILADQRLSGTDPITITPNNLTVRYIDQYGEDMSSPPDSPTWYVSEDGATQITEVQLSYEVTKAGTYAFFAQWNGVRSNALTLTVYPAATLNRIVIADNPQDKVLGEYILGSGTNTFDLTKLSVSGYDTLGNPYALSGADMTWRVNGTEYKDGQFTVTKEGTYQIDCYHPDTVSSILSNKLTLTVLPATSITRLVIADDPLTPLLKDYLIGSGSDSFDLSQLTVTGYDQYGNPVDADAISWYVNGAMLSRSTLTVTQVGTYEIYAAYQAGSVMVKSNSLTLNVLTRVTGIQLNAQEVKLAAGDTFKLVATAEPAGETDRYTFTSAKPEVATVDSAGNIKALVQGETLITVAGASGVEAQCLVTVVAAPETVRISPDEMLLGLGDSHQLTPILTPAWSTSVLTYYSSDESVAYVNSSGLVTARALGEAVISVTTHNGRRADCYVKVVNRPNDIEAPEQLVLGVGETADLDAQVAVKTAQAKVLTVLTYDSKDPSVASVSDGGVVTAHKVGQCTIVITSYNGLDRMVNVQVKEAPGKVTLSESKLSLEHGESATLAYTLPEGSAGKVTYRSSKPAYVRVNSDGKITAMKKGSAVITATTYNGKKATCKVTVTGKNPLTLKVKGEVDVLRPDSCVTLTPSITAGYTDFTLTITAVKGKQDLGDVTQKFQITKLDSGALEIRKKPDAILKTGGTYTATVAMKKDGRSLVATKTFKVKKGSAKALLSQKTVKLSAGTPQAEIQVTMKDSKLAAISKITSVSQKFSFSYLGDGKVRVSLIGGQVPKKGETLKLKVFLQGHDEAAATVKLQIKLDN